MPQPVVYSWKQSPFIRLLLPLITGIILQWYLQLAFNVWNYAGAFSFAALIFLFFIPFFSRYRFAWLNGIVVSTLFISAGALLVWLKDIRHHSDWFGFFYKNGDAVVVTLQEPPVEKTNSFKALAVTESVQHNKPVTASGNIIIYFQKDSAIKNLAYGSVIVFTNNLQAIKNAGNPGGFDYKRYCLFQQITHQVYLKSGEYIILPQKNERWLRSFLFSIREKVLDILRTYIPGSKEAGLAEALLIGYKDDLDKSLVQSYSNTGVVHVIAISGLHLGLIYWLLLQLMKPLRKRKNLRWVSAIIIIVFLWLFSLLAGAQASVLRSAVMFTCIVAGQSFARKTSIFNTLALSAFLLLCYNPYWLWDVGFQLSYAAVLSIVIFMRPIYNWLYIKNKALDFVWKLNAVTIAAQAFTIPLSLYHFHQFPNFFLLTNLIAVPLSSIILIGEILLCVIAFIPFIAAWTGKLLSCLIWLMNTYIERIDSLPFAIWDNIQLSILQAVLLIIIAGSAGYWLLEKKKTGAIIAIASLLFFVLLRSYSFYKTSHQQKLIVYNVPKHAAIDVIDGRYYSFIGDTALLSDDFLRNFHLKPSRILHRITPAPAQNSMHCFQYKSKRIMLIDRSVSYSYLHEKIPVDLLVISKNPKLYITSLLKTFSLKQVVFDGSVPAWKMKYWKKDCDSLHIPYYDVSEKGAFIMTLN